MSNVKRASRKKLHISDPGKILDLVLNLTDDKCADIQIKINTYLCEETEADLVLQVIVNSERYEAFIEVVGIRQLRKVKLKISKIFSEVLKRNSEKKELLENFNAEFQNIVTPFLPKDNVKRRVLLVPILDNPFAVIFCIIAQDINGDTVTEVVHECALFTWPTLKKTIALEYEVALKILCQSLLRIAKRLFSQVASLDTLLHITTDLAKDLIKAEFCSVLLIDTARMDMFDPSTKDKPNERRFPLNIGIAGAVIRSGILINTQNALEHPAYDSLVDGMPDKECRNILCFPLREQAGIIGVLQLVNKLGAPYFDAMDEEVALAFSMYCGVCIIHSVLYQRIQEAYIRNALANELVMYHMKVSDQEIGNILGCVGYHLHPHITNLHFNLKVLPPRELPCYVLKMFSDLGLDKTFKIMKGKLACFILHVKKGYRDVPYHSWNHSFNVGQWAYAAVINFKLVKNGYFNELQVLMFVLAGLMHDLDHRGTTNSFQIQGQTTLAALYSSEGSVMERHHLAQAMCILNTEGCDILEPLPRRDYDRALLLLKDFILATDLANFFRKKNEYQVIAIDFQKGNRLHINAMSCLLMNCADLSDQLKDWCSIKKTAAAVLTEFFNQGDVEKSRGELPALMMDRDKCFIPDLEIDFLKNICVPLFQIVGTILPKALACIKILENHIERWDAAKPIFAEVPITAGLAVLLSPELDTLIEQNLRERELERRRLELEHIEEDMAAAITAAIDAATVAADDDDE